MSATGPAPWVATCQAMMNATKIAIDTTVARRLIGRFMIFPRRDCDRCGDGQIDPAPIVIKPA